MRTLLTSVAAAAGIALAAGAAQAFECPSHFAKAEDAIAAATDAMNGMPDGADKGLAHTLIDDAKMLLESGKHNHSKPAAGGYDHARAIAKAQAAIGYAEAARIYASQ